MGHALVRGNSDIKWKISKLAEQKSSNTGIKGVLAIRNSEWEDTVYYVALAKSAD